jgi:tetratricopeptide (TPR) repeat protein
MEHSPEDESLPAEARECLIEAYRLVDEGRLGGAAQKCERVLEQVPNWAEANRLYSRVLEQMGFVAKARMFYERAARPDALSCDVPHPLPQQESQSLDILAGSSYRPQEILNTARAAWRAGKLGSALRACESALAFDAHWAEAHNLRGLVLDDLDRPEDAAAAYLEAVRRDPSFAEARYNLFKAGVAVEDDGDFANLVAIRAFLFASEAEIARGRLEAEEIPAIIIQGEIVDMNLLLSNAVDGVKLCVRVQDAQKARAVFDRDMAVVGPDRRCPQCGSGWVRHKGHMPPWGYGLIQLVRMLLVGKNRWTCRQCGASWREKL